MDLVLFCFLQLATYFALNFTSTCDLTVSIKTIFINDKIKSQIRLDLAGAYSFQFTLIKIIGWYLYFFDESILQIGSRNCINTRVHYFL